MSQKTEVVDLRVGLQLGRDSDSTLRLTFIIQRFRGLPIIGPAVLWVARARARKLEQSFAPDRPTFVDNRAYADVVNFKAGQVSGIIEIETRR